MKEFARTDDAEWLLNQYPILTSVLKAVFCILFSKDLFCYWPNNNLNVKVRNADKIPDRKNWMCYKIRVFGYTGIVSICGEKSE